MIRTEIKVWVASSSTEPTWRDGLDGSDRTYLVLAVPKVSRNGYQAFVFGRGVESGKLKFYPTPEALGIDRRSLAAMGIDNCRDRSEGGMGSGYVRYYATLEQVKKLLEGLDPELWSICPVSELELVLLNDTGRYSSRLRAPEDCEHIPVDMVQDPVTDEGGIKVEPCAEEVNTPYPELSDLCGDPLPKSGDTEGHSDLDVDPTKPD